VFPGVDQPITSRVLRAVTDDVVQSRTINYAVVSGPKLGRLRVKDARHDSGGDLTQFSQDQLDAGAIVYRPLANATDSPWTGVVDSILLEVSTAYATNLRDVTLPVNISYANLNADNAHALVKSLPLRTDESGAPPVTQKQIDARPLQRRLAAIGVSRIVYVIVTAPQHGRLAIAGGKTATSGYRLSERQLVDDIIYVHDGSDTTQDHFRLSVELATAGSEVVSLDHVITVNITIRPVDDEPLQLMTQSPELEVLQVNSRVLTLRRPLLPYGYSHKASRARPG